MHKKVLTAFVTFIFFISAFSQTQTPIYLSQAVASGSVKGYYEYLPADYNTTTKNYPLIIWAHGSGQGGQGNLADLPKVLQYGLPKMISEGGFPASYISGGNNFSFIVISPQFTTGWPNGTMLTGMIDYVMSSYRIDPDRIYLMGMSAGGGGVWDCASMNTTNSNRLAAIIPFCGAYAPTQPKANIIAAGKLPVWAFHNTNDGTVSVQYSRDWVNFINAYSPAYNPAARLTEFPVISSDAVIAHDSWSTALLPTYKPNGINIYEWMLQYTRRIISVNSAPQSNAGIDQGVVLPANVLLDGSASNDPDGVIVSYKWKKISGPSSYSFIDSTVINPTVRNLVTGVYQFELLVTDNLGANSIDNVTVNVYPSIPAGVQQRILIDIGADASKGGIITSSPNLNGNAWNNMTNALPGVRVSNAVTIANQVTNLGLEVINRLDGTFSPGQPGIGSGNNAIIVGDYPGSATTDHALVHSSATNGRWKIFGMDTGKVYVIKFWGARTNTTASRSIEIKRADNNVWLTYNATGNTNFNNAAVFNISGVTEMNFDIRTKAGSDFSCINVLDISFNNGSTSPPQPPVNTAPVAKAGNDITINYPANSVALNGCQSSDYENAPLTYKWRQISGPQNATIVTDIQCNTGVNNLVAGIYNFELAVKDTGNLIGKDSVLVTVNNLMPTPWPPATAPVCSQPYKVVVIGSSSAYGTGANPIDSSWVNKFRMYVQQQNAQVTVTNIATLGLTSYQVLPTGFVPPANRPVPDVDRNITKALSLSPDAIIINLPSNDIAMGYTLQECYDNFNRLASACDQQNVPVWVSTTQPRDRLSPNEKLMQLTLRDWIIQRFANKSVDFWTTVGNDDGSMNIIYSAGDSVHLNNYGHHILFTRVVSEKIWDTICLRRNLVPPANQLPVARAGSDQTIQLPVNRIFLDGRTSTDADGTIVSFQWALLSGPSGSQFLTGTKDTTSVTFNNAGIYTIRLVVTDNSGATASDDVIVTIQSPATTGSGRTIRVNIFGGSNPYLNTAWNNWNSVGGVSSTNFLYEDGSASSVNAMFNTQAGMADNGAAYASSATVCPGAVLRYNSYTTSIRTLTFKGLDITKKYYLEFYGSRANSGNSTVVNIGNVSDTINTDNNINDFAKFNTITPQSNGNITINLSRIGTYNYVAGFIIREEMLSGKGIVPTSLVSENKTRPYELKEQPSLLNKIFVYPNPFVEKIQVMVPGTYADLTLYDMAQRVIWHKTMTSNKEHINEMIPTTNLKSGLYILSIQNKMGVFSQKMIKN